jgi:hypothetical protein
MATYIKRPFQRVEGQATSVTTSTVATLSNVPTRGYIARVHVVLKSGAGATVAPVISTDSTGADVIQQIISTTADANVDEIPGAPVSYVATLVGQVPTLYLKLGPDTGTDNVVDYAIDFWPGEL